MGTNANEKTLTPVATIPKKIVESQVSLCVLAPISVPRRSARESFFPWGRAASSQVCDKVEPKRLRGDDQLNFCNLLHR